IDDIPGRYELSQAARSWYQIRDAAERYDMSVAERRRPSVLDSHSRVSRPEDVYNVWRKSRVVARGEPLVVREIRKQRTLPRKFRDCVLFVILQAASPEEGMLAVGGQVVIQPRDVGVPVEMYRRVEAKPLGIEPVSGGVVVWKRVLLEYRHHICVRT